MGVRLVLAVPPVAGALEGDWKTVDYLVSPPQFSSLSLRDVLEARDQFHVHLMHKPNVVGTAVGRYLIRTSDPYPHPEPEDALADAAPTPPAPKSKRTLENSEVRGYSWPCVLVFVSRWVDEDEFGGGQRYSSADFVPGTIYLEDGRRVPICVVEAPLVEEAPPPLDPTKLELPPSLQGGYPVYVDVQNQRHVASIGCLLTDGHTIYALTNRHVAGRSGEQLFTFVDGQEVPVGRTSDKQLTRLPFSRLYENWPARNVCVNVDVGLIELEDVTQWSPSVYRIGTLGPLADLSVHNLTLNLIGCPVQAYGCASGRLQGQISALFYRYQSVGGLEYVADFLIGSRGGEPLLTRPGDSGTAWVLDTDSPAQGRMPLAVQWGGTVFSAAEGRLPFALATNLSNVCRELDVDLFRSRGLATFDYWGAVGHYTIGSFACTLPSDPDLKQLMLKNRTRISFDPAQIGPGLNNIHTPGFVQLADVPDKTWKDRRSPQTPWGRSPLENPSHYADMDFRPPGGGPSLFDLTPNAAALHPNTWIHYYQGIGWNLVSQRGLLPFRVWQIYKKMVEFVAAGKVAEFLTAAGVLTHYVGDACQPLHGSMYDDGDPFRHPDGSPSTEFLHHGKAFAHGVHSAYESAMLDDTVDQQNGLLALLPAQLNGPHGMPLLQGGQEAGFAAIELSKRSQATIPPKDIVTAYATIQANHQRSQASTLLWQQFGPKTVQVIADGCRTLAMLWDSAWAEGIAQRGQSIPAADIRTYAPSELQPIYEDQSFLPSVALGQIAPHL